MKNVLWSPWLTLVLVLIVRVGAAYGQEADPVTINPEAVQKVEVDEGRSVVLTPRWPVARVSVADPEVADVQVLSEMEVVVLGRSTGVTDLFLWNKEGECLHAEVHVVQNLGMLEERVSEYFPGSLITLSDAQGVVVARGVFRRVEDVKQLDTILKNVLRDQKGEKFVNLTTVAGVQQVMLKVRVAEASRGATRTLGVDLLYGGDRFLGVSRPSGLQGTPDVTAGFDEPFSSRTIPLSPTSSLLGVFPEADLAVTIDALVENQYMRILAEPTLVALSGEEASFLAGGEFPIPVVRSGSGGGDGGNSGTSISIEFKEFGVRLSFRPTVLGDGRIRMQISPEVSELSSEGAVTIQGFTVPAIRTRRADTTLEMNSGQTFALAGLLSHNVSAQARKIPGLGDVPVLGPLFRSVRYERGETELIVLATVELVEPLSETGHNLMPGDQNLEPSDWELYLEGRLQGREPGAISPGRARTFKQLGFDGLTGPGAWATHGSEERE